MRAAYFGNVRSNFMLFLSQNLFNHRIHAGHGSYNGENDDAKGCGPQIFITLHAKPEAYADGTENGEACPRRYRNAVQRVKIIGLPVLPLIHVLSTVSGRAGFAFSKMGTLNTNCIYTATVYHNHCHLAINLAGFLSLIPSIHKRASTIRPAACPSP